MSVRISAVVATRNRASYLRKALTSLVAQTLPQELYEIIVVDNASTDNTQEVVGEFSDRPNLRYCYEPIVGVSRARNTGWRNAQGAYIAFLDDDAVAYPDWLAKFLDTFETFVPSPGCLGGRCLPIWEAPRPDWLSDEMLSCFAIFHYADVPIILNARQWLTIGNAAYPSELLQAAGGLREDLGRKGNTLLGSADTYLRQQLDSWGFCSVYHPEIVVGHHIPASRLTKSWSRQYWYWQGLSSAIIVNPADQPLPFLRRAGLMLKRTGWALPRLALMLVATNPAARFKRQCQVLEALGYVSGLCR